MTEDGAEPEKVPGLYGTVDCPSAPLSEAADPVTVPTQTALAPADTRILVTDDQPQMLDLMDRALGDTYACEFASSIDQALEKLGSGTFQLAICNIQTAGADGWELAQRIVKDYPDTATVVLLTGEDDRRAARDAFALGVYAYLVEPFWPGQLLITVMSALRRRELEIKVAAHVQDIEDRRQAIIDMAPIPIYAKDLSGHYIVANAKADELAGLQHGELVGLTDEAFLSPEELEIGTGSDRRVIEEQASHEREDTVEIAGETKVLKSVRFPLFNREGEVDAVGGISVDISAETEAVGLRDQLSLAEERAIEELRLSHRETIAGLSNALDLHDPSTGKHIERVAGVAALLGARLGLDENRVELLRAAAPMHDVGKIGTPAVILCKPGILTKEERTEMQRHTIVGHEIFSRFRSELARLAGTIALTHHERFDGSGYPHGLAGEEIPLEGRIVTVADVFDALLSDRSYRPALSVEEAVAVMEEGRGTHFDPRVVDLLLRHLEEALSIRADLDVSRGA